MATTSTDILNEALYALGMLWPGDTATTPVLTDASMHLAQLWSAWGATNELCNAQYHQTLTVTAGTSAYTFGTAGTLVASATPVEIVGAQSVSGNFKIPIKIVSFAQFDALVEDQLSMTSVYAQFLAVDNAYPSINLKLWPTPATSPASLVLDYYGAMTALPLYPSVATLSLAPEYERALWTNLAVDLIPRYALPGRDYSALIALADQARNTIIQKNKLIFGQKAAA